MPRPTSESNIITIALKRRLSDTHIVQKEYVRPDMVNAALHTLKKINPLYKDVKINESWNTVSELDNPELWKAVSIPQTDEYNDIQIDSTANVAHLTNEHSDLPGHDYEATTLDSEDEVDADNPENVVQDEKMKKSVITNTCIQALTGPNVKTNQIINLAPGEGQRPIALSKEPHWEALAFLDSFLQKQTPTILKGQLS